MLARMSRAVSCALRNLHEKAYSRCEVNAEKSYAASLIIICFTVYYGKVSGALGRLEADDLQDGLVSVAEPVRNASAR